MWLESLILREEGLCRRKPWVSAEVESLPGTYEGLRQAPSNVVVVTVINLPISVPDLDSSKALFDPTLFCAVNYSVYFNYLLHN